jgi:hypothetical protein
MPARYFLTKMDQFFNLNPNEKIVSTVKGEVVIPQPVIERNVQFLNKLNKLIKGEDNIMNKEQKYFIGFAVYYNLNDVRGYDIFGEIIYTNEEITSELLKEINETLLEKLNEGTENNPYTNVQVFNIVKLD